MEGGVQGLGDGKDLVAGESRQQEGDTEAPGQDLGTFEALLVAQAPLHVVGGAAVEVSVRVRAAVVAGQRYLRHLDGHAESRPGQDPEQGARSADGDGGCHTAQGTHAHGAAHGHADGFKGGDLAGALLTGGLHGTQGLSENQTEIAEYEKFGTDGQ